MFFKEAGPMLTIENSSKRQHAFAEKKNIKDSIVFEKTERQLLELFLFIFALASIKPHFDGEPNGRTNEPKANNCAHNRF